MKLLQLTGNVGTIKELKNNYTSCGLAITERKKNEDGSYEDSTTWFNIYWKTPEFPNYNTGDLITVIGNFKQSIYTVEGQHRIQTDIWPTYQRRVLAKKIEDDYPAEK